MPTLLVFSRVKTAFPSARFLSMPRYLASMPALQLCHPTVLSFASLKPPLRVLIPLFYHRAFTIPRM